MLCFIERRTNLFGLRKLVTKRFALTFFHIRRGTVLTLVDGILDVVNGVL